jgi:hypothetical protein
MAEIRPLTDFFNPMQTGMQVMALQNQQQNIAINQAQLAQQERAGKLTALSQTMAQAPLSEQYPILKQYAEVAGVPIDLLPSQNAFISNPDLFQKFVLAAPGSQEQAQYANELKKMGPSALAESQKLAGPGMKVAAGKALRGAAGSTEENPALDLAVSEFGPAQTQASQVAFQTPLEKSKAQAMINQVAMVKVEGEHLIGPKNAARAELEEARPLLDAYEEYSQQRTQEGRTKAMQKFDLTPGLSDFDQRRIEQMPQIKREIEHFRGVRQEMATNLERLGMGLPMTGKFQNMTPEVVDAKFRALNNVMELKQAQLDFYSNPSKETYGRYATIQQRLEDRALALRQTHMSIEQLQLADKQGKEQREVVEKQQLAEAQTKYAQRYAKMGPNPTDSAITQLAGEIAGQYPGIAPQQLIMNLHNKALVQNEIKMPGTMEEAGKVSMITNALTNVADVRKAITNKDGSVNRDLVFETFTNLPFSQGRELNSMIEDAIAAKLRAETGAAANADEVKSIARRFGISSFDKDSVILGKLNRLERFLQNTMDVRDPSGQIRGTIGGGTVGAPRAGAIQGGYRFKGGDPSKQDNWEKVK